MENVHVVGEETASLNHSVKNYIIDNYVILQLTTNKYYDTNMKLLNQPLKPDTECIQKVQDVIRNFDSQLELSKKIVETD